MSGRLMQTFSGNNKEQNVFFVFVFLPERLLMQMSAFCMKFYECGPCSLTGVSRDKASCTQEVLHL